MYKLCKQYRPFSKYFVLDQDACLTYLVQNGLISCIKHAKDTLNFEGWTQQLCTTAIRSGQISTLEFLINSGLTCNKEIAQLECTNGTCNLDMIKYLRELGASWSSAEVRKTLSKYTTEMEQMAHHGHLDCMKYAFENGCDQLQISHTPSLACLDFAIQNGFLWKRTAEEAAKHGNLDVLKHAHQRGASLYDSAEHAARGGHFDCLVYVVDKMKHPLPVPGRGRVPTTDCFKYWAQHFGFPNNKSVWIRQIMAGNVEILRLLLQYKVPLLLSPPLLILTTRSVDVFKFMLDEAKVSFAQIDPYVCCARHGNLEGLKLAFERNLPISPTIQMIIYEAVRSKNLELLKYVWEKFPNKEGFRMETIQPTASTQSTPEILDFLTQQGAQWSSGYLTRTARLGNLPSLAYFTRIGCKYRILSSCAY